jgi:glycosyltransferase involved in cell wall biosynthesis
MQMNRPQKRVVWFCGLPEKVREEIFSDLNLPAGPSWSWVVAHLPVPSHIDLHIICPSRFLKENVVRKWGGATFHLVKVPQGGTYLLYEGWIPAMVKVAHELSADIVHGWGTECAFSLAALRTSAARHVVGIQGILAVTWPVMPKTILTLLSVFNERRILRKARHCVAESFYSKKTVSRYTSASVDVVYHPLREEFLSAPLGIRSEKIIIYLGVLAKRKGLFDALDAFLGLSSDWKLVCIGSAREKERSKIESYLKNKDIGERVIFTGSQSSEEIMRWFQRSPVFLLPSYTDTGPTALKEALSMGLWPICYDNTGPKELIGRYNVGSLVPTGNVKKLNKTLGQVLSDKPWQDIGRMELVSHKIRTDLSPLMIWEKLDSVYDGIIK